MLPLLPETYLKAYEMQQPFTLTKHIARLKKKRAGIEFSFYVAASALYSSRIEGNPMDMATFLRHRDMGATRSKPYKEIQDLIQSYDFARLHLFGYRNVMAAHRTLSQTMLSESPEYRGKIRNKGVHIYNTQTGEIIYTGASVDIVELAWRQLIREAKQLLARPLTTQESFYYAALLHLRVVQIHPFADGNGRIARLMEK